MGYLLWVVRVNVFGSLLCPYVYSLLIKFDF